MTIAGRDLEERVYIIAELSANHNRDFELAKKAVRVAHEAGCDAIKLQTYTPDTLTLDVKNDWFKASDLWEGEYLYDLYGRACMPWEWHAPLKAYADTLGIDLFSSPFDATAVDLLESLEVPAYKIASYEITDIPLIAYAASKGRPIILSTGIAGEEDIRLAVQTCRKAGNDQIILLKCTSAYPAPPESMNLRTIPDLAERFGVVAGLSDHTLGTEAVVAAVALGARVIEKHFTPDPAVETPDSAFSLSPEGLKEMVRSVRRAEKMLGGVDYTEKSKQYARSLFVSRDVKKGELFTQENVRSIRPGNGLHPKYYDALLGTPAQCDIPAGTPLDKTMVTPLPE